MRKMWLSGVVIIGFVLLATPVFARTTQAHVRTGLVSGNYSGSLSKQFELMNVLDFDYEFFIAQDRSFLFRFLNGVDTPDAKVYYTYGGAGFRYYFHGKGAHNLFQEPDLSIASTPKWRSYLGFDLGVSQVTTRGQYGPNVQSVANMADLGLNIGTIYQVSKKFGIEGHVGASGGIGITSTPTSGSSGRVFLGGTYYF